MIWLELILLVVSFIGLAFLSPKPQSESQRAATLNDFTYPHATDGAPIPLALGKIRIDGPNTLWYGDLHTSVITVQTSSGFFGIGAQSQNIGFRYFLGFDLGLCLGPDVQLWKIWAEKFIVYTGGTASNSSPGGGLTEHTPGSIGPAETAASVNFGSLWGGDQSGGGLSGTFHFYGGEFNHTQNSYLISKIGPDVPAYRGQARCVFQGFYVGNSASLHQLSFEVSRYTTALGLGTNKIGDDLNPMEALYFILVDDWAGMAIDSSTINSTSFASAAAVLASEGNGLSLLVANPNQGKDIIVEILRQVDGVLYEDPATGLLTVKLIRNDYDPSSLLEFDESTVLQVKGFSRTMWSETFNEVRVTYTDRSSNYTQSTAMAQDMSNINAQGRRRSQTISMPGITVAQVAADVAQRELSQISVPLFKVTLTLNRAGISLRPGDVFKFSWAQYEIVNAIMRVQRIDQGELAAGNIVIDCIQDRFADNVTVFAVPVPATQTTPGLRVPIDIGTSQQWFEVPYFLMQTQGKVAKPLPSGSAWSWAVAREPDNFQSLYTFTDTADSGFVSGLVTEVNHLAYTHTALLDASVGATSGLTDGVINVIIHLPHPDPSFLTPFGEPGVRAGNGLFIVDSEIFGYSAFTDNGDGTFTLACRRALLDTKFSGHSAGAIVYFLDSINGLGLSTWGGTQQIYGKFQSSTDQGDFDITLASLLSLQMTQRYDRPLPPDLPQLNGSSSPTTITTQFVSGSTPWPVTWANRSRLDGSIKFENDASSTLEAGQTTRLEVWLDFGLGAGLVEQTGLRQTGLTGTSAGITFASPTTATGEIRLYAVSAGGLFSHVNAVIPINLIVP